VNEINSFTFYRDYYFLIDTLPLKDKKELAIAILDYVFKDETPNLSGHNQAIFNTLSYQLNLSKSNSKRRTKKEPEENRKETEEKPKDKPKKNKTSILSFKFYISNLNILNLNNKDNIYKLFNEYLELRKKNKYTVKETVVKRLINKLNEYGTTDEEKIEIITNAINGAWKDFYPLKKHEEKPNWYGKEYAGTPASDEELKELEERLKRI
jgi:hypothetical protein